MSDFDYYLISAASIRALLDYADELERIYRPAAEAIRATNPPPITSDRSNP